MRYLIASEYHYYDDFSFSNVCVCDTLERAEELVQEFKNNIEIYKNTQGYEIYIDKECNEYEELISEYIAAKIESDDIIKIFISENKFEEFKQIIADNQELYFEEISFYNFLIDMYWNNKSDDIRSRYCNHEEAVLYIHEIPSM